MSTFVSRKSLIIGMPHFSENVFERTTVPDIATGLDQHPTSALLSLFFGPVSLFLGPGRTNPLLVGKPHAKWHIRMPN